MRPGWRWGTLALAALAAPAAFAQGSAPGAEPAGVTAELVRIERSLERVAAALEQVLENQRVELILRRIEIKERRLAPLEARARDAEAEAANHRTQMQQLEAGLEQLKRQLAEGVRDGNDRPDSPNRQEIAHVQAYHESLTKLVEDAERRAREHDDRIAAERREIAALDDLLAELVE